MMIWIGGCCYLFVCFVFVYCVVCYWSRVVYEIWYREMFMVYEKVIDIEN